MTTRLDAIVIGGGFAGLLAGWFLQRQGRDAVVVEASGRPGGLVRTWSYRGARLEAGPQSLQTSPEVWALLDQLGLRERVLPAHPDAGRRFLLGNGGLSALPHGPGGLMQIPGLRRRDALRLLVEPLIPARSTPDGESVHSFVRRRFGPRAADALADPFVAGVFGGDPRHLDISSAFPELPALERATGGVIGGMIQRLRQGARQRPDWAPRTSTVSFLEGMEELPRALAVGLADRLHLHEPAHALHHDREGWTVETPDATYRARHLWMACPLPTTARLLHAPDLQVPTAPIAAVTLAFARESVPSPPRGFGWLCPSSLRSDVLGCLWVDRIFPSHTPGLVLRRVMLGGARRPDLAAWPEDSLIAHAQQILAQVEGLTASPLFTRVSAVLEGIPQYPPGWSRRVEEWQHRWPDLSLIGWGTTGIGLRHLILRAHQAFPQRQP